MNKRIRILFVFFTVMSFLFFSLSSYSLLRRHFLVEWESVEGSLLDAVVEPRVLNFKKGHGVVYEIRLKYAYEANGDLYYGQDFGVLDGFSTEAEAEDEASRYVKKCDGIVPVLYNNEDLDDSFIVSPDGDMETLIVWSASISYLVIFSIFKFMNRLGRLKLKKSLSF